MDQWPLFAATAIEGLALEIPFIQRDDGGKTPEGQAAIAVNAEKLRHPLARLQGNLAAQKWLVGNRFTAADINTAGCVRQEGPPDPADRIPGGKNLAGKVPGPPRLSGNVGVASGRNRLRWRPWPAATGGFPPPTQGLAAPAPPEDIWGRGSRKNRSSTPTADQASPRSAFPFTAIGVPACSAYQR